MAARRTKAVEPQPEPEPENPVEFKARRFHRVQQAGWELAWLVASSVTNAGPGRPSKNDSQESIMGGRVSMRQFATIAEVSQPTVSRYYKAWELAAGDHPVYGCQVPKADTLNPNDLQMPEEIIDAEAVESLAQPFSFYLEWARTGKVPETEDDSIEEEEESEPSKPQLSVVEDEDDETDSVDEDFGLPDEDEPEETEDERIEADTAIQAEKLRDILESINSIAEKVSDIEVLGSNDSIMAQIAEAASGLATTATALSAKTEAA